MGQYPFNDISSNLTWATGYSSETTLNHERMDFNQQDWASARQYFYTHLTGRDYPGNIIALDEGSRNNYLAMTLKALGQAMHLLQDMAVPAHVRNDFSQGHTMVSPGPEAPWKWIGNAFEAFVKRNDKAHWFSLPPVSAEFQTSLITNLWDTDQLTYTAAPTNMVGLGLSEYTSMNFLSEYRMFTPEFPFPKAEHCAVVLDSPPDALTTLDRQYISSANGHPGEIVNHLAIVSYLKHFRDAYYPANIISSEQLPLWMDENCYNEYAEKLVPRAVGYSAALLDYFFRGTLQIRRPFVKLASDGTDIFIGGFEFEVKNTSAIGQTAEALKDGTLELVYRYLPEGTTVPVYGIAGPERILHKADGLAYDIDSADDEINSEYVRLSVDLALGEYIPRSATELSFMLVYSGTLGHELNTAVAVGSHRFDQASLADKTRFLFDGQILYGHTPGTPVPGLTYPINLYTVLADGDDLRPLTDVDTTPVTNAPYLAYFQPAWSPDGRLIAYRKNYCSAGGRTELFETPWIGCEDYTEHDHPDHYLYISDLTAGFDGNHPITTLAWPFDFYPGGNPESQPSFLYMPTFAPDSRHVLGVIQESHSFVMNLFVYNIEDRAHALVGGYILSDTVIFKGAMYRKKFYHSVPAWSPDGERIAYYVDEMRNDAPIGITYPKDIFVLSPSLYRDEGQLIVDGFNDMPLTNDAHFNTQPSWSPDSRWLVFASNRDHAADDATQAMDIWIMDRNGQNLKRIYNGQFDCMNPGFSPDGTRIAFLEGGGAICTVALDGSDYRVIVSANSISDSEGEVLRDILSHLSWSPYLDEFAPTVTLQVDAVTVTEGETVTLTWSSTSADRIVLDNGLGDQTQMNGAIDIAPTASATYTVTAYNWAGKATASVSITVE